jgi:hypothetical protein
MPPGEEVPTVDSFLVWFDSLPTEVQREVLHHVARHERESLFRVNIVELFENAAFHVPARLCPVVSLN